MRIAINVGPYFILWTYVWNDRTMRQCRLESVGQSAFVAYSAPRLVVSLHRYSNDINDGSIPSLSKSKISTDLTNIWELCHAITAFIDSKYGQTITGPDRTYHVSFSIYFQSVFLEFFCLSRVVD